MFSSCLSTCPIIVNAVSHLEGIPSNLEEMWTWTVEWTEFGGPRSKPLWPHGLAFLWPQHVVNTLREFPHTWKKCPSDLINEHCDITKHLFCCYSTIHMITVLKTSLWNHNILKRSSAYYSTPQVRSSRSRNSFRPVLFSSTMTVTMTITITMTKLFCWRPIFLTGDNYWETVVVWMHKSMLDFDNRNKNNLLI